MKASHYVIEDLLKALETEDKKDEVVLFKKFVKRYKDDSELKEIADAFLKSNDIKKAKAKLNELKSIRGRETSGGTQLPFEDRRHLK